MVSECIYIIYLYINSKNIFEFLKYYIQYLNLANEMHFIKFFIS